jgi:hypothetical protein
MISQYWKDQIPAKPLSIQVKDSGGLDYDLSDYATIEVKMLGTDNQEVSLTGSSVITANKNVGKIKFVWPTDRSLFKNTGDYVLQLKLSGTGKLDFTTTHTIRVRELGRTR